MHVFLSCSAAMHVVIISLVMAITLSPHFAGGAPTGAVLGIDFGTDNCVVAIARRKGVDIVANEASQRCTPSVVSFGAKQRFLGEGGNSQRMTNVKNTVTNLKELVGVSSNDQIFKSEFKDSLFNIIDSNGEASVKVSLSGTERTFTPVQLVSMLLTNLKQIAQADHGSEVVDCVLGVPVYFNEKQRHCIRDAAEIAGLKCLRLINENTATALAYGITKTDLPEPPTKARHVVFVDCGYSCLQVSVVAFQKGQLKVLAHAFDKSFGGKHLDEMLFQHFAEDFKQRFKVDARTNAKAALRLRTQCERLKKSLSANPVDLDTPINVECMMEDKDVSGLLNRGQMESMLSERQLLGRMAATCERALGLSGVNKADIDSVEVVGGTSRVPAVRVKLEEVFKKECKTTLNAAESVARGSALACAMLSPAFRVREFKMVDWNLLPVRISCLRGADDAATQLSVSRGEAVPCEKRATLSANGPLVVSCAGSASTDPGDDEAAAAAAEEPLGQFEVPLRDAGSAPRPLALKVQAGLDLSGCVAPPTVLLEREVEVKVDPPKPAKPPPAPAAAAATGANASESAAAGDSLMEDAVPPLPQFKKVLRQERLEVRELVSQRLSAERLAALKAQEVEMALQDKTVIDTQDAKNRLEEFVYVTRDRLSGSLAPHVEAGPRDALLAQLEEVEGWLYGEGEEAERTVYVEKLAELKRISEPIERLARDYEDFPAAAQSLRRASKAAKEFAATKKAAYDHITADERDTVVNEAMQAEAWCAP